MSEACKAEVKRLEDMEAHAVVSEHGTDILEFLGSEKYCIGYQDGRIDGIEWAAKVAPESSPGCDYCGGPGGCICADAHRLNGVLQMLVKNSDAAGASHASFGRMGASMLANSFKEACQRALNGESRKDIEGC